MFIYAASFFFFFNSNLNNLMQGVALPLLFIYSGDIKMHTSHSPSIPSVSVLANISLHSLSSPTPFHIRCEAGLRPSIGKLIHG